MGDFQLFAAQMMILIQVGVGGAAFWGVCKLLSRLSDNEA